MSWQDGIEAAAALQTGWGEEHIAIEAAVAEWSRCECDGGVIVRTLPDGTTEAEPCEACLLGRRPFAVVPDDVDGWRIVPLAVENPGVRTRLVSPWELPWPWEPS